MEQTEGEHNRAESELRNSRKEKETLVIRLKDKKAELADSEEYLHREREELAAMTSKLESMKEMDQEQNSLPDESIRTLCQVADIFSTPAEYETAIEAILRDKLGASIVEDQEEIIRALQFIKDQKSKRSGFIAVRPLEKGAARDVGSSPFLSQSGVVGEAIKYVSVKEGFDHVAASLLHDVCLVDSLSTAFSLWKDSSVSHHH